MPGRVVCWQSPPPLLRDRDRACLGTICHLGLLMLCRPRTELRLFSLLDLACPCSFPACCVTHWCQGSRGECLRPSLPQQGGRGKEAEPPAPASPWQQPAHHTQHPGIRSEPPCTCHSIAGLQPWLFNLLQHQLLCLAPQLHSRDGQDRKGLPHSAQNHGVHLLCKWGSPVCATSLGQLSPVTQGCGRCEE